MSKFKFRYMHINKCGGTSIHQWFGDNDILPFDSAPGDHVIILNFDPEITNITTVRNPYNRVNSIFNQWRKNGWLQEMKLKTFVKLLSECIKKESCENLIKPDVWNRWPDIPDFRSPVGVRMIMPCSYWIKNLKGFEIFKQRGAIY